MSCVCRYWQFVIMHDEYFLNQWFSQSLKRSQQTFPPAGALVINNGEHWLRLKIDQSLFPAKLRSSGCCLLPWIVSRDSSANAGLLGHFSPLPLIASSYSLSFWLFLPHQCKLNIEIDNFNFNGLAFFLHNDKIYDFNKGKVLLMANQWIHIVLTKNNSQSDYRIWIDGQYVSKLGQCHRSLNEIERLCLSIKIILLHKFDSNSLDASDKIRVADFNAIKRCLTSVEIQAIYDQQTSISQVKVGTYINSK